MTESDVRWEDGDLIFEDEDVLFYPPESTLEVQEPRHGVVNDVVEFVPKEDAFATQEPSHAVVSTNCSLTFEALLSVTSPDHGLVSTEQNVTLSGSVSVTDTEHGVFGTHPTVDTSKFLSIAGSVHSLFASQQDLTLHTELIADNSVHKISGTHPILAYTAEQNIAVQSAIHGLVGDEVGVTEHGEITVTDTEHGVVSPGAANVSAQLSVSDSSHGMTVETPDLTLTVEISAVDMAFVVSTTPVQITKHVGELVVNDIVIGITGAEPSLTGDFQCAAQDTEHGLVSGVADFTSSNELSVTDSVLEMSAESAGIVGSKILGVQDANHGLFVAEQLLSGDLYVSGLEAQHGITGDTPTLTVNALIYGIDTAHGLISDSPSVSGQELVVTSPAHGMVVDVPTLGQRKLKENFTAIQRPYLVISNSDEYFYTGRNMSYHYITKKAA